jgi:hypothetical protein
MTETQRTEALARTVRTALKSRWNNVQPGRARVRINAVGFFYDKGLLQIHRLRVHAVREMQDEIAVRGACFGRNLDIVLPAHDLACAPL